MPDYPEELYASFPFDTKHVSTDFDSEPEGVQVGIYVFAGTATVKVRREALLMNDDGTIARSASQK